MSVGLGQKIVTSLFQLGDEIYKVARPHIKEYITKQGGKPVTKIAADKINKNPSTVTSVNQIKPKGRANLKPKTKVVKPKSGVTSQQRSALSDMGGRTVGVKPRSNVTTSRTTSAASKPKGNKQVAKRVQDLVASAARGSKTRSGGSVPSGGTKTMRNVTPPKPRPKSPLGRPSKSPSISNRQRVGNIGKAAVTTGTGIAALQKMKPKTSTVTAPKSRPQVQGPPKAKAKPSEGKDPRGNQIKPTPGKMIMPKKFDGGYNSKTQKLVNITVDGKKATYEIPKGMTTKQAKSLLTGTVKKYDGGRPGFKAKPKKMPLPKVKPKSKKTPPSKYKGFSKLPESVQKRISPNLASKYEEGGSIKMKPITMPKPKRKKKPGYTAKPAPMPKPNPKKKPGFKGKPITMPKKYKGGGSIGTDKVARQVKGFGAARRPKK